MPSWEENHRKEWDEYYKELGIEYHHNKNCHLIDEAIEEQMANEKAILDEFINKSDEKKKP